MQLETIRSLIDWLQYGTNGPAGAGDGPGSVNALSSVVVRDAGDAAPAAVVTFGDETRTPWLARRHLARESGLAYPLLGVLGTDSGDIDGEVETAVRDGRLAVSIVYAQHEELTEQGLCDWHYTARALQQSVKLWLLNSNVAYRTRNSIIVLACEGMKLNAPFTMAGDVVLAGGLSLQLTVRDTTP